MQIVCIFSLFMPLAIYKGSKAGLEWSKVEDMMEQNEE